MTSENKPYRGLIWTPERKAAHGELTRASMAPADVRRRISARERGVAMSRKRLSVAERAERREDRQMELLLGPAADEFTKALDAHGWMIVPQPEFAYGRRWTLNRPSSDCPWWCDDGYRERPKPRPPRLRLIDGNTPPDPEPA
jgi:hypothetical protein